MVLEGVAPAVPPPSRPYGQSCHPDRGARAQCSVRGYGPAMDADTILVVGAGPAGLSTARAYRAAGGDRPVTLVGAEARAPYQRPPLTKGYLRGETPPGDLPLEDDAWYTDHDVALRAGERVVALDPAARRARTDAGGDLPFAACVLATGSRPRRPPVPGADLPGVHDVRTVDDADGLRAAVREGAEVVVLGSGFIGCEAAASAARRGARVTLLTGERVPHERRLGAWAGTRIAAWLSAEGVTLRTGARAAAVERADGRLVVVADDRTRLPADAVVCATGVAPRLELAEQAGLVLAGGGVATDEHLRASAPGMLAVGDIAFAHNRAAGRPLRVEHWGDALAMGEVAGRVLAGEADAAWTTAPGFWSTIGDRTLKHSAWGDGHDDAEVEGDDDAWAVRYRRGGRLVGVLAHERDDVYEAGTDALAGGPAG